MRIILFLISFLFLYGTSYAYDVEVTSCKKWDATTVAQNSDWLSSACTPQNSTHTVKHTIQVACPSAVVVEIDITTTRSDTSATLLKTLVVNSGVALAVNSIYQFVIVLAPGDTWNIQHSTTATIACSLQTYESNNLNL